MNTKELTLDGIAIREILYSVFNASFDRFFVDDGTTVQCTERPYFYKDFEFIIKFTTSKGYHPLLVKYKGDSIVKVEITPSMLQTSPFHIGVIIWAIDNKVDIDLHQDKED